MPNPEHIFADERPFAECHASTLARLADGRFLAAWFGGTHESTDDVGIWGSTRDSQGWSPPRLLAKTRDHAHWNPVLHRDDEGAVHLFFKVGQRIARWETWVTRSADGGQTWDAPRELVPGDRGGRGPVKNKLLVLDDGTWLAGASLENDEGWDVFVDRSKDNGQTWDATPLIERDPQVFSGRGAIQPTLWQSAPNTVHMLLRTTCGRVGRSNSTDNGRTWSPLYLTDLPHNNSGLDLARLQDGTLALACNPVEKGRTPVALLLSDDNGETWTRRLDLETEKGEYSYPAIISTQGGIALTYTWKRERVAFWRLAADDVPPTDKATA